MAGEVTKTKLDGLKDGINAALGRVDQLVNAEAYAEKLPILGDKLATAAQAIESVTLLQTALYNAVNVVSGLSDLATKTTADIADALNTQIQQYLTPLRNSYGYLGNASASVDSNGNVTIAVDSGRTVDVPFTLTDLGMSGLGLNLSGQANAQLSYNLDFRLGADSGGFWFDTNSSNVAFGARLDLNGLAVGGNLGPLHFAVSNIQDNDPAADADTLSFDIASSWNGNPGVIRNFTADLLDFRATGSVDLDLHLAADMGNAALPSINADFHVDWDFNQALLNGSGTNSWSAASVSFTDVNYDFGSFVSLYIQPILSQLAPYLGPINEALAIFRTDISGVLLPEIADALDVVHDGKVTLLDFMQLAANVKHTNIDIGGLSSVIDTLAKIVDFANYFSGRQYSNEGYQIGNWQGLLQDIQGATGSLSALDVNAGNFTNQSIGIGQFIDNLGQLAQTAYLATHQGAILNGATGKDLLVSLVGDPLLSFPIIENPASVIQLLLGKDIDLFKLDLPAINIALGFDAAGNITQPINILTVPIWPAPLVAVQVNAAAQVLVDLAAGYDTSGLRQYATGGFVNPGLVFNGFYLDDQRSGGVDKPEITIRAGIELGALFDAFVIGASVNGSLVGEILLDLADSIVGPDGKLHVDELLAVSAFPANPFAIFDVSGRLSVGLRAEVHSGPIYWVNWNSPRYTLLNFGGKADAGVPEPDPGLASFLGSSLYLHTGQNAGLRLIANTTDGAEIYDVSQLSDGRILVTAFDKDWVYTGAAKIEGDGGNGDDDLVLDATVTLDARLSGGIGNDYLVGGGGSDDLSGGVGSDVVRGAAGTDTLFGDEGNDYLEGGAGGDSLHGGDGSDVATYANAAAAVVLNLTSGVHGGDAAGDSFDSIEAFEGSRYDDGFTGGAGADTFSGLAGNDMLSGMGGDDLLAGGIGTNAIDGGDGFDIVNYRSSTAAITVTMVGLGGTVTAGSTAGNTINDTLSNVEQIEGSANNDVMTGGAGRQIFVGNEGADTLSGGADGDILVGGLGGDTLIGGDGIDTASYQFASAAVTLSLASGGTGGEAAGDSFATIENIYGSQYNDTLTGDALANMIEGNDGNDTLSGGAGNDVLVGGVGTDTLNGGDDDDTLIGGAAGDALNGGAGFDFASYRDSTAAITLDRVANTATGDAASDTFSSIEGIEGTDYNDTIRGTDNSTATASAIVTLSGDNQNNAGTGGADGDIGVNGNWTAANPVEFDLAVAGAPAVLSATLTITATGVDAASGTTRAERDEVWVNGAFVGMLASGAASSTTLVVDPLLLTGGLNRVVIRNVNPAGDGSYSFSVTGASLSYSTASGLEEIRGGIGVDILSGAGGIDRILGGVGNDVLDGEADADLLYGEAGNDRLYGGDGNDLLDGGADDDFIIGGAGNDVIHGGAGVDDVAGGEGDDQVLGGAGNDTLNGSAGIDVLLGGDGDDVLHGNDDADVIAGEAGNDQLYGDGGTDTILAGAGNDGFDGGADRDIVLYAGAPGSVRVNLSGATQVLGGISVAAWTARDGFGTVDSFAQVGGLSSVEDARGGEFDDVLAASEAGSRLDGLFGDDVLIGLGGDDLLKGGDGSDGVYGGDGNDTIIGGGGTDVLRGEGGTADWLSYEEDSSGATAHLGIGSAIDGSGATDTFSGFENLRGSGYGDTLTGDQFANRIEGLAGNDVIDGGLGADTLVGGLGDDIYFVNGATTSAMVTDDVVSDDSGYDIVKSSVNYTLGSDIEDLQLLGSATIGIGNGGGNLLIGNAGNNILDGLFGADTYWGFGGDDTYIFDQLGDRIGTSDAPRSGLSGAGEVAGGGNDTIKLATTFIVGRNSNGSEYVWTYSLNDAGFEQVDNVELTDNARQVNLTGNALGNRLVGNDWSQVIRGEGGDDTMVTGIGDDDTFGGDGNDTLVVDWSRGIYGVDMYTVTFANTALGGYDGDFRLANQSWYASFVSTERFEITTGSGGDNIKLGNGDDIAILNAGDDFVNVASGFDRGDGGDGVDGITADYSAETLAINWNLAANSYSEGTDGTANDHRAFTNFEWFGSLTTGSGNDVIVTTTDGRNDVVRTGDGNDRVTFRVGDDDLYAGLGLDTLVVDWSAGIYGVDMRVPTTVNATLGGFDGDFRLANQSWYASFESVERFEITTGSGGDNIVTMTGDDIVKLGAGNDFVNIGSGRDDGDGGTDNDGISADYRTDTTAILWDLQANTYSGAGRAFTNFEYFGTLRTGGGNDVIVTDKLNIAETIITGDGNDRATFFSGNDTYNAGADLDTLVVDWSAGIYGVDTPGLPTVNVGGGFDGVYRLANQSWSVSYTNVERFEISTGSGGDTVTTATGDDIVRLGAGHDFVNIGSGRDEGDGGTENDGISADYRTDTTAILWNLQANTYSGAGRVFTNFEYFGTLRTGSGNDVIVTGTLTADETIITGDGNDRVTVFSGNDTYNAGGDLDTLVVDWSAGIYGVDSPELPIANVGGGFDGRYRLANQSWSVAYTNVERFEILTGSAGDNVTTATGDDIVKSGAGDDWVNVGSGRDEGDGGDGTDRISADYSADTAAVQWSLPANTYSGSGRIFTNFEYFGTLKTGNGNDVIVTGTVVADEAVESGAGNDRVTFSGGNDGYTAGAGADTLVVDWSAGVYNVDTQTSPGGTLAAGYAGAYRLANQSWSVNYTGVERFEISAGSGSDSVVTGDGDDIVRLGDGDDFVNVRAGRDEADGGAGTDRISADYSTDTVAVLWNLAANTSSGSGRVFTNFEMFGTLKTGSGNDVIVTGTVVADEAVESGAGNDRVTFSGGNDGYTAGAGADTLVIDWSAAIYGADASAVPSGSLAAGYAGGFRVSNHSWSVGYTGVERFEITTGSAGDSIVTAAGDDIVNSGAGDDVVNVGSGYDRGNGGDGVDRISADYSAETLGINWNLAANAYSEGTDGAANDTRAFTNFEYFGTLKTGSGNDVIVTGTVVADEAVESGAGNDRVTFSGGNDGYTAGDGTDTLVIDWSAAIYGADASAVPNGSLAAGYAGGFRVSNHSWSVGYTGVERFEITTGSAGDSIVTAAGDDIVNSGAGDDVVNVGSGYDRGNGGDGVDRISADYSAETLGINWNLAANAYSEGTDGAANDTRAFTNFEYFGTLKTGSGNDVIVTATVVAGESVSTGAGDDRVTFFGGNDGFAAGDGIDTLVIDWSAAIYGADTSAQPNGSVATGHAGGFRVSNQSWSVDYSGVERFEISTGSAGDSLYTGGGDDIVRTGGGNDYFETRGGNDLLDGGTGDDTMVGGTGDDSYTIDSLGDVVTENANEGSDSVLTALVAYTLAANVENLTGTNAAFGQALTGNALANVILGSSFNDMIDGGAGDDRLSGGDGNDFFKMGSGALNEIFGDGGTDTLVLSDMLVDYSFSMTSDGRVMVVDNRDPSGTIGYLRSVERIEIEGGSITLAQAMAGSLAGKLPGTSGDDAVMLTTPGQVVNLAQGGTDFVTGTNAIDYILFGPTLDPTDSINASDGVDQLGLQGNYTMTLGSNVLGIDYLALLSGANTAFGDTGAHRYTYNLSTTNATVGAGIEFVIQANALLADEALTFDGSAEIDGSFLLFAGLGVDSVKGGLNSDRFFFGEGGRYTPADSIDGLSGIDDQLGLRGDYASTPVIMTATSMVNIDTLVLLSGSDVRFGSQAQSYNYNITTVDANVAAGAQLRISANTLQPNETVRFDGTAEADGRFFLVLGNGADVVKGGTGADTFFGWGGADTMTGGGGADTYIYLFVTDTTPMTRDTVTDFATGDRIDLSRIDAISGGADDAFTFVNQAAFSGVVGELRAVDSGTAWLIEADVDGDGQADFAINLTTDHPIVSTDFIL